MYIYALFMAITLPLMTPIFIFVLPYFSIRLSMGLRLALSREQEAGADGSSTLDTSMQALAMTLFIHSKESMLADLRLLKTMYNL